MQRIIINEIDETTNVLTPAPSDIIFVPGLAVGGDADPFEPVLCTSLAEFEKQFGAVAPVFATDQLYPTGAKGFANNAVSTEGEDGPVMFKAGECDPSYVYAKELVRRGMNVMYERINLAPGEGESPDAYINVASIYSALDVVYSNALSQNMINSFFIKGYKGEYKADVEYNEGDIVFKADSTYVLKGSIGLGNKDTLFTLKDLEASIGDAYLCNSILTTADEPTDPSQKAEGTIYGQPVDASVGEYIICDSSTIDEKGKITCTWEVVAKKDLPTSNGYFEYLRDEEGEDAPLTWVELSDSDIYAEVEFTPLTDRNEFDVKYLTSGGYPTFEFCGNSIVHKMMAIAEERGDCMVFIDHTNNPHRSLLATNKRSVYASVSNSEYKITDEMGIAQMYTPYCMYTNTWATSNENSFIALPGSFAYMLCLAASLKYNPSWLAIAGVNRGIVPTSIFNCENLDRRLTVPIAESYTDENGGISINAITNVKPYGYSVWGNRTLKATEQGTKATSFSNIRNLVCDVKKVAYKAAKSCLFEQNTDILWGNFKAQVSELLDKMVVGAGLSGYNFVRNMDTDRTKIEATIIIYPVYAVESFEITVVLSDDDEITVEE